MTLQFLLPLRNSPPTPFTAFSSSCFHVISYFYCHSSPSHHPPSFLSFLFVLSASSFTPSILLNIFLSSLLPPQFSFSLPLFPSLFRCLSLSLLFIVTHTLSLLILLSLFTILLILLSLPSFPSPFLTHSLSRHIFPHSLISSLTFPSRFIGFSIWTHTHSLLLHIPYYILPLTVYLPPSSRLTCASVIQVHVINNL